MAAKKKFNARVLYMRNIKMLQENGNTPISTVGESLNNKVKDLSFEAFLKKASEGDFGLTISVATRGPLHFPKGTIFSNVKENSSWIGFTAQATPTAKSSTYRTDETKKDRDGLVSWYKSPVQEPFSKMKGEETVFGPPGVTFLKI